jgi:hypothetical protein
VDHDLAQVDRLLERDLVVADVATGHGLSFCCGAVSPTVNS